MLNLTPAASILLTNSETIKDLEIPEGRRLLHDFYHDNRVRHSFEIAVLLSCWRLCRIGRDIQYSDGRRVRLETNLGFKLGTRVFAEEILSHYYYNFIHGLVYLGSVILLVSVGLYLLDFDLWIPVVGFAIEAFFLFLFAVVTAYSPSDDAYKAGHGMGLPEHVLVSVNNSVREMTGAVSDLLRLISQSDIRQDVLLTRLTEFLSKSNTENVRVFTDKLEEMNDLLRQHLAQSERAATGDKIVEQ